MNLKSLDQNDFNMKIIKDLGMLYPNKNSKRRSRYAIFECSKCKNHFKLSTYNVKKNNQKYCRSCSRKTHGLRSTKISKVWDSMKSRCYFKKSKHYKNYGGRGITVCEEWKNSLEAFAEWAIDNGYKNEKIGANNKQNKLTIDRINNDKGYSPENCRIVDYHIQAANKRKTDKNTSGYIGVTKIKLKNKNIFLSQIKHSNKNIVIGRFDTVLDAAKARDQYIIDNNLTEYTLNNVL